MQKKFFGLFLSLGVPVIYMLFVNPMFVKPAVDEPFSTLIGFSLFWGLAILVLFFTRTVEALPLTSIGWRPLTWKSVLTAIGLGILLSLLVPALTLLVGAIIPQTNSGTVTEVVSSHSWWILILSVITAGVTEEILFRGYSLERLTEITGSKWISGIISLMFFIAVHAAGWNLTHLISVVLPLGAILTSIYFWQRNLLFVIIVHTVIDFPLIIMATLS